MVGGDAEVLERVRPVLDRFGRTVVHVGPTGAGAAAKVAVNGLLHTFSTALAESMVAAEAAGVPRTALFDVLAGGVLANTFLGYKRAAFVDPDSAPVAFDLRTATKDLRLAVEASRTAHLPVSVLERTLQLHSQALEDGYGDKDMAAMASWFGVRAGDDPDDAASGRTLEGQ
jgi:3-hydroxyisobutyrate dehydrogenase/2-hydroxy-3-oxopropionate reductase